MSFILPTSPPATPCPSSILFCLSGHQNMVPESVQVGLTAESERATYQSRGSPRVLRRSWRRPKVRYILALPLVLKRSLIVKQREASRPVEREKRSSHETNAIVQADHRSYCVFLLGLSKDSGSAWELSACPGSSANKPGW